MPVGPPRAQETPHSGPPAVVKNVLGLLDRAIALLLCCFQREPEGSVHHSTHTLAKETSSLLQVTR